VAKDQYQYFRVEARELLEGLGRGVLQLEKEATPELVAALLRFAHTLKGAARVVKQPAIAEHAHAIEDVLAPLRDPGAAISADGIDRVLKALDAVSERVVALDAPPRKDPPETPAAGPRPVPAEGPRPVPAEELPRTVRADVAEVDALLDGLSEAGVQLRAMRGAVDAAGRARHLAELLADQLAPLRAADGTTSPRLRSLADELRILTASLEQSITSGVDQTERQVRQLRGAAERLRLFPASSLFAALERSARDVGHALGKAVTFAASGGDVRLDAQVLHVVQGALVQMVRNAVAHGIETENERTRAGKPPAGRVELEVARRGTRVAFICRDDGRGVDVGAVRRAAARAGLISAAAAERLDEDAVLRLLFKGGLTTSRTATETSGRGVGLDIVGEASARLAGDVTVQTVPGAGTRIELVVPISLSSLDALLVEAGGVKAAIPLDSVRLTLRLTKDDVVRTAVGDSIVYEGRVIPFVPLAASIRGNPARSDAGAWTAVVLEGNAALAALGVDRLLGTANVVVRSLPALAPADPLIAGAAMDSEGTPQLVLEPVGLVAAAQRARGQSGALEARPAAPILVIDDSLTTRMLEQSILESAGYEVDLATSAEEGLEKARRRTYQLFLVDVEMPGMDGFAFVERTRADPVLRETPAILVTSLNSPEDRRRGAEAGAYAYIVKGDFDQALLLDTIRRLGR
jgi:two-component system chemotaxis sensor kinase CheA